MESLNILSAEFYATLDGGVFNYVAVIKTDNAHHVVGEGEGASVAMLDAFEKLLGHKLTADFTGDINTDWPVMLAAANSKLAKPVIDGRPGAHFHHRT